ncbi:uncharacterized protein LOC135339291 [Halichondria panicea]|uniref:uncharacterized protein LOC135339291 n=1 Tax=Halichondria panicea TaxID=6063 RepID=UPI00312B6EDA
MEFDLGGGEVTLLQFTPLNDSYSQSYGYGQQQMPTCTTEDVELYGGSMHSVSGFSTTGTANSMEMSATPSPNPPPAPTAMQHPEYYCQTEQYAMETNCQSPYSYMNQQPTTQGYNDYIHSPQVASPAVSAATSYDSQSVDLDSLDMLLNDPMGADLGPQPVRLPRLEEEPPRTKESAYSSSTLFLPHRGSSRSNPHSPIDIRVKSDTLKSSRRHRGVVSTASLKSLSKRVSSPIFPDYSTPLSSVSLSRHPSITSLCSSTKSDPFSNVTPSVRSDPGPYRIHANNNADSASESPSVMSAQDSQRFLFTSSASSTENIPVSSENSSRSCMEIAMPMKLARKITDLDKKIMKLQADRSKLLEKAKVTGPFNEVMNVDTRMLTERSSEIGRIHLYIVPLGIHALDEPLYEDANATLRQVGGLYFDYQSAVDSLRSNCCKGMVRLPDISTCFAYIKSLLNENQRLKLGNSIAGFCRIQLDLDTATASGYADGSVPTEFVESLRVANQVMQCAQQITKAYPTVQMHLQQVRQTAAAKADKCDTICQSLGIIDRERRTQIKSVLEGNCTIMSSVERVWPQYYQVATETIKTITECIHPPA